MLTRDVPAEELREIAAKIAALDPNDVLCWLGGELQLEAAMRKEAFDANDKVAGNRHDLRADKFGAAVVEVTKLRNRIAAFTEVLGNRLIVALQEAKRPGWQATHQHYKGTLYRVTGQRQNAEGEELVDGVDYDDATGKRYWLPIVRWESTLESGRLRYRPLLGDAGK